MSMGIFPAAKRDFIVKGVIFFLLFAFAAGVFMVDVWDPDFWWHLATGKWIVEHGRLPEEDPFSFATLQQDPYTSINRVKFILTQYWLAQITFYKIYSLSGFAGISVFRALLLTLTVVVIALILRRHRVHAVLILPVAAASILLLKASTGERPQLFSFLFAALLLYLLEGIRGADSVQRIADSEKQTTRYPLYATRYPLHVNRYTLYAIPFLMALWSNLHGGYIYGVVIILIYISSGWMNIFVAGLRGRRELRTPDSGSELKRHALFTAIGLIAVAATFLNPNTYHGIIDHFRYSPTVYFMNISEMQPTYRFLEEKAGYFGMLVLLAALILVDIARRRRADINHILLFLFNAALSLSAIRFVPFFIISGSFLLGIYLKPLLPLKAFERRKWLEGAALPALSLLIAAFIFFVQGTSMKQLWKTGVTYGSYPYNSAKFLKTLPPGKVFNPYAWGGYLIWALYPGSKVFIDGRGLNQEVFIQYAEVMQTAGSEKYAGRQKWKAILDGYNIDYLLLAPLMDFASNWSLINAVAGDKDWKLVYSDNASLVYVRNKDEFRDIIDRHSLPSDLAYATTAWQAIEKAKVEKTKKKKVEYYLIAADALTRMNKVKNARLSINKALQLEPENPTAKAYAKALGMETGNRQ